MRKQGDWWLRLFATCAILVILAALSVLLFVDHTRRELSSFRAALEKQGEPLSIGALMPPPASPKDNGAHDLLEAAREIHRLIKTKVLRRLTTAQSNTKGPGPMEIYHQRPTARLATEQVGGSPFKEVPWSEAVTNLGPAQPHLENLRRALQSPLVEFHPDYREGIRIRLDDGTALLSADQALWAEAVVSLHDGKPSLAVDDIVAMLRIARAMQRQPLLLSQLLTLSVIRMAAGATWEVLQAEGVSAGDLDRLQAEWNSTRPAANLQASLRMERAITLPCFDHASAAMEAASGGWSGPWSASHSLADLSPEMVASTAALGTWSLLFRYHDEEAFIRDYQRVIDSVPVGEGNWKAYLDSVKKIESHLAEEGLSRLVSRFLLPGSLARFPSIEAARSLCVTAIALRRYQLTHDGQLPATLSALQPDFLASIPFDPMDGTPLKYQLTGPGKYLLYAIGSDAQDNGGDSSLLPGRAYGDFVDRIDIVWPIPARP